MNYLKRTWCEINLDYLKYNIKLLREIAQKELIAVVKANAYGHGDRYICQALQQAGIHFFAVSNINEAFNLRHNGIQGEILILGYTPPELANKLIDGNITQTIHCTEYARQLNSAATHGIVKVHVKVDTGMHRIGFLQDGTHQAANEIFSLNQYQNLDICGIFTHFCCSDSFDPEDKSFTQKQMEYLDYLIEQLELRGMRFSVIHAQNSAGITNYANSRYNYARAGISMYGLNPSSDVVGNPPIKPILSLKTVVSMVKEIPSGAQVGYGRTYTADHPIRTATLAIGYADGYSRQFSNCAEVLIHGTRCPVIGRVCMDQMMVDISHAGDVQMGDIATIIGTDGQEYISADELAALSKTINYELVCNISIRVPRVYFENGSEINFVDYSLE